MSRGRPPKLSEREVEEIKNSSLTNIELAGLYKVSEAQISRIRSGLSRNVHFANSPSQ
jgi:hypothetical protein